MRLLVPILTVLLLASVARAEPVTTRFGTVDWQARDDGQSDVVWQGRTLVTIAADDVTLFRVTLDQGNNEYVIVQSWVPGLNCHNTYRLLHLQADGRALVSPAFGNCTELTGALPEHGGVTVELTETVRKRGKAVHQRYHFHQGRLRRIS